MARLTLLLALFAAFAVAAMAARFDFDERALLAELEGRPAARDSLLTLSDLSPESLQLLHSDGVEAAQSLLQVHHTVQAASENEGEADHAALLEVFAESGAQAQADLAEAKLNAHQAAEFAEGLEQFAHADAEQLAEAESDAVLLETEADAEAEAESGSEAYAEAETFADMEQSAEAEMETEAEAEAEMETEAEAEAYSALAISTDAEFLSSQGGQLDSERLSESEVLQQLASELPSMPGMMDAGEQLQADADFPEANAALVEMQSQASAAAAVSAQATAQAMVEGLLANQGRLGNYPGWTPTALLEMMAEKAEEPAAKKDEPAPAAAAAAADAEGKQPAAAAAAPAPFAEGQFNPVKMNLPPSSDNVHHIRIGSKTGLSKIATKAKLGVSKVNVHVYGAPDVDHDKQRALQSMVRRLANDQSDSYKKINALIRKLKLCQVGGKAQACLPKITEKIEDWKAEWLAEAKRA